MLQNQENTFKINLYGQKQNQNITICDEKILQFIPQKTNFPNTSRTLT